MYSLLDRAILDDAPFTLHEGHLIKPGYNSELDELKSISAGSKDFILEIEQQERERTGIKNLKVGFNKVFGYFIEVSKGQKHLIKDEYGYAYFHVMTDRGECRFTINMGSNAVVRLSDSRLLITDSDENRFEIRDVFALTQKEQRKLDLFL